ncbi:MAG: DUF6291 domain-containing protein [Coriobacteriaceae bacterium]|uniref:DUF6291 domain-containing protein n=1 Tax=Tractidigestivibacter sp. TaxID=2847320 RepID=UPI002A81BEC8|nr:DUF6291 domain-containing protein [Tractidigestivibacter sp.]MCI6844457.1 DUF6291 domain-containing protein [Coriobacteriaceae bacterium]MDY4535464.1 DUF6291 domain-containing protein [Tractidigestivibacter sp.]MDY5272151.1 DUF6291 domain-containing protein [Tractidigestivibacter sp.]
MDGAKFTWFPKLTSTVAKVPEEHRGLFLWALAQYGTYGIEPELAWPLDAIFESLREDIDNSKRSIENGRRGGRGNKNGAPEKREAGFTEQETPLFETGKGGLEDSQAIPGQSSPIHTNPDQKKSNRRFQKPTLQEVSDYAAEMGNPTFDAQNFIDYYESNGWKVGRNPMKDWKATVRNWVRKDKPKKGGGYIADYD